MKIYFTHSEKLKNEAKIAIINGLKNTGHSVKTIETPENLEILNSLESKKIFENNIKKIKVADIVIAELSFNSIGVGYDISYALDEKKPVVVLYNMSENKENAFHIPYLPINIKGNSSRYLILKEYDSRNLEKSIELGLKDARSLINSKFILIIPPDIDKYLEWCVKERGMAKAAATREALRFIMKKNEDYRNFLKDNL